MKKFLFLIFSLFCIVLVTSCNNTKKPPVEMVEVIFDTQGGSSIASVEVKKGEKIERPQDPLKEGFTFVNWYPIKECTGNPFDFATAIMADMTLYAKWNEAVKPEDEVLSIEIKTQPTKQNYIEGEAFDPTGMVVEATLKDESKKEITDYTLMPSAGQEVSLGLEMFSVTYKDFEVFGSITVVAKEIVSVEVETNPKKTSYKNYESFDPTGLVLKVSYNNGKSELIETGFTYDREMLYNAPSVTKVVYEDVEVEIPITVEKIPHYGVPNAKESTWVDAKAIYDKLGLTQDSNRIEASTVFGELEVVASPGRVMQWEGVGNEKYYYNYFDQSFEGLLKFAGATSPEGRYIVLKPTVDARFYFWASCPSSVQTQLLIYNNYTEATLPEEAIRVISLVNEGVEDSFPVYAGETYYITATANAFIRGMGLVYNPTYHEVKEVNVDATNACKDFAAGQQFNYDGLVVHVKLANDEVKALKASQYEVVIPDLTTPGEKTITVRYQDALEKTYKIMVHALTGIKVLQLPTKYEYFAGENLELEGLKVVAFTANDISYEITGYVISKMENLLVDDVIMISWNDFETQLEIEILENPISGIQVKTPPTKTVYKSGETFNPAGLVLEKVFTGRDPEIIPDLSEVTFDKTVLSVGDTKVLATWDIFSCEIEIEVIAVDWYDLDDTVYINATDLLTALGIELNESTPASGNIAVGSKGDFGVLHVEAINKALQYERIRETYTYGGYTYTGVFKTGGVTGSDAGADRYISVTPEKNGVFTFYCTAKAATSIFLLEELVMPSAEDANSYVAKQDLTGDGVYTEINFTMEAGKTYYFWFTQQTFIRGMNLCYARAHTIVEELILDTTVTKLTFALNEEFSYEGLKVSVRCEDGNTYELKAEEFVVVAPDMTTAGTKKVEVKFKEVTIKTYEIVVS